MDQVRSLLHRPRAYYNIDGVGELGMGVMCLAWALLWWMDVHTPADSLWHQMYFFLIYVGLLSLVLHYGSKAIKKHITYPRTGYVEYRKGRMRWLAFVTGALASIGFAVAIRRHWGTTPVLLFGLFTAGAYVYHLARSVRWKWAVVWAIVLGSFAIALLPAEALEAVAKGQGEDSAQLIGAFLLFLIFYGVLALISGGISFWLYLRHTQPPAQEGQ